MRPEKIARKKKVLVDGLELMGCPLSILQDLVQEAQADHDNCQKLLDAWKEDAKRAYREAITRWHPDKPEGCEEKTKLLNECWELVQVLKVLRRAPMPPPPPPPPPPQYRPQPQTQVIIRMYGFHPQHGITSLGTDTVTGTHTDYDPLQAAHFFRNVSWKGSGW